MSAIKCVANVHNILGEGPWWCTQEQALYWVDIQASLLQRFMPETQEVTTWTLPCRASAVFKRQYGGLLLATEDGVVAYDVNTGMMESLAHPEAFHPHNRSNESKVDPQGRLWMGTMDDRVQQKSGALYRINPDGYCEEILSGLGIPNTMAWNADNTIMYFGDSMDATIYQYDFDKVTGSISNPREFFNTKKENISPDGSAIDAQGYVWNAQWDGWRVVRYAPSGEVDRIIELPVQRPTSCMFGGKDLTTLFITSAKQDLTEEQLKQQPLAGGLFAIEVDVAGVAETAFGG